MKGRTKFFNYFIACIATLSLATFAACSDDDPETPSGKLVLTASASSFVAGEGNVTFMVTYDGEDVTSQAAITNVTTGEPVENAAWTTTEIGEYKFQAVYDSYTSDPVTVSAIDKNKDKDKEFYRYVLLLKFTYMTCGNCVTAQGYFDALDEADRDHFLVVAAHQPEGMPMDPYWCSEGISLKSKMKVGVYPTWSYNFEDLVVGIGAGAISKTSIRQQISHAEKTYPAVCGVKATSTLEGSTAKIEATVQFQQAGNYKIACVLVENNIENKETYNTFLLSTCSRKRRTLPLSSITGPYVPSAGKSIINMSPSNSFGCIWEENRKAGVFSAFLLRMLCRIPNICKKSSTVWPRI